MLQRAEREQMASEENGDTKLNDMGSEEEGLNSDEGTGSDITAEAPPASSHADHKLHMNGSVEEKDELLSS